MTANSVRDRLNMLAMIVAMFLLIPGGCARDAASSDDDVRARGMRDLAETGDRQSIDALIDGLEDESESVRRQAQRGLSDTLKRNIYFDPSASREDRSQAVAGVRGMWQNLQERDLVEAVKERMPLKYFYDLNTGEVFEDLAGPGPLETPSGPYQGMPSGVRAVVVACSDCSDEADRYVGWLEIPAAALSQYGISYETAGGLESVQFAIRRPDGGDWALIGTAAAEAITADARRCEQREIPMPCRPGR